MATREQERDHRYIYLSATGTEMMLLEVLMSQLMMSEVVSKQTDLHDVLMFLLVLPITFVLEGAPQQDPTSLPKDGFPR